MAARNQARARQAPTVVWAAQPKQGAFISCPCDDVGFGGARGGGKSDAVIGDFISHEDYYGADAIALAFRRERTQLVELMERARVVMLPLGFRWHEQEKYFRGPKGGRLRFAYLESDADADAYQGHSYTRIYPEEMGTFPREAPINKMMATLRSGAGVPCQMKGTMNPGGVGHNWVKERYKLAQHPRGYQVFRTEYTNPYTGRAVEKTRVFIPSHLGDNRYLGDDYAAQLFQVGAQELVRAWLEGDWSIVSGSYFPEWSAARHVVEPFPIPPAWARFRSGDWGSARPFSFGWWAVAGDDYPLPNDRVIPRGALVRYREWYGSNGQPDVGLRLTAEEVGKGIDEREGDEPRLPLPGVLDPRCFANDGGPSIAERMYDCYAEAGQVARKKGPAHRPADNARVARVGAMGGWDQLRARLIGTARRHTETGEILWSTGSPMIYFFSTCRDSIRTIPALPHDLLRPEDVDTEAEDHCFAAGTLVDTLDGAVPIEMLPEKGWVRSLGGRFERYRSARRTAQGAKLVRLGFMDGSSVVCTPDHKFLVSTDEMRYASDLQGKEVLCSPSCSVTPFRYLMASAITYAAGILATVTMAACTSTCGSTTKARYHQAIKSTMWMKIATTIQLIIWNVSPSRSTWAVAMASNRQSAGNSIWPRPAQQRPNGTALLRASNGTLNTMTSISIPQWLSALLRFASNVAKIIWSRLPKLSRENSAGLIVERALCVSVEELNERSDVYCLTVPNTGVFALANGLLVSNCADETRYACMSRPYMRREQAQEPSKMLSTDPSQNTVTMTDLWNAHERRSKRVGGSRIR